MKTFWYLKFDGKPIRVTGGGGFEIPEWSYWTKGIHDITRFPKREYAVVNLKLLRECRTKKYGKRFTLVKVTVR